MSWTTDPDYEPAVVYPRGWATAAVPETPVFPSGWVVLLEKVGQLVGTGNLSAIVAPKTILYGVFSGEGSYDPVPAARERRDLTLTGNGSLTGYLYQLVEMMVAFSGSGALTSALNDGLSAILVGSYPAHFGGSGSLLAEVVGGEPASDGLSAVLFERYLRSGMFTGSGDLIAMLGEIKIALADFAGSGTLSATSKQVYELLAGLAGAGTLSAGAYELYVMLANLAGSGALTAPALAKYLRSIGFDGAGTLTSLLFQSFSSSGSAGGSGTVSATVKQVYTIEAHFGD